MQTLEWASMGEYTQHYKECKEAPSSNKHEVDLKPYRLIINSVSVLNILPRIILRDTWNSIQKQNLAVWLLLLAVTLLWLQKSLWTIDFLKCDLKLRALKNSGHLFLAL